jgi:tetratricopeptide (TPR) repeat protein
MSWFLYFNPITPEESKDQFNLAWELRNQGDFNKVMNIAQSGLEKARLQNDKASEALFLKIYAQVHSDKNELSESLAIYKKIENIYIELGLGPQQMHTLCHIASIYLELGEAECAEKCQKQVIEFYKNNPPNDLEQANSFRVYAIALEDLKDPRNALNYWERAKTIYGELDIKEGVQECEEHLDALNI